MNLIVNRRLGRQEELAIYELTLKKQRSKKSTVSEKHAAAMQQLAEELSQERKQLNCALPSIANAGHEQEEAQRAHPKQQQQQQTAIGLLPLDRQILCRCHTAQAALAPLGNAHNENKQQKHTQRQSDLVITGSEKLPQVELQRQSSTSTIATDTTSDSSSGSSSSSSSSAQVELRLHHFPSSASSLQQQQQQQQQQQRRNVAKSTSFLSTTGSTSGGSTGASCCLPDEASIKLAQLRLEQLNNELERRLHQYEYLVAQEKAILGAYKLNLFTNEGVNNFQSFEVHKKQLHSSQSWSNFQLNQARKF